MELEVSLAVGAVAALGCGFTYGYPMYSSRIQQTTGISSEDVVVVGVLSVAGLGAFMYPASLSIEAARRRGFSPRFIDVVAILLQGVMLVSSTLGIAAALDTAASSPPSSTRAVLEFCFFVYGAGFGLCFQQVTTVANFNLNSFPKAVRRSRLAALSLCIALGAVVFVLVYQYALASLPLPSIFYGLSLWYAAVTAAQVRWMKRVRPRQGSTAGQSPTPAASGESEGLSNPSHLPAPAPSPAPPQTHHHVTLRELLSVRLVQETLVSGFFGIGVSGTFLSSIGNFQSSDLTFGLTLTFLCAQAAARLANAVLYAARDFPMLFAVWQLCCLVGVSAYYAVDENSDSAAFAASALCGLAFGGLQSSTPVLCSTSFPGGPSDFAQSFGVAMLVTSMGTIVVGEVTTAVGVGSLEDMRGGKYSRMFTVFVVLSVVATALAVDLGRRIARSNKEAAAAAGPEAPGAAASAATGSSAPLNQTSEPAAARVLPQRSRTPSGLDDVSVGGGSTVLNGDAAFANGGGELELV